MIGGTVSAILFIIILIVVVKMYRKALQGQALVRTGMGGTKVNFSGILVWPIIHKLEIMDITLKTIVIARTGKEGLICKDNMRADIKVTFFVRVNQTIEDVKQVAQSIGSHRASSQESLELLFDAKFSEALKTVGKNFDFVELYSGRDNFKQDILNIIGTDLNGYVLDDCAIDYLEQTPITDLDENNILDAEGIKKIIDLTATQKMKSNQIQREKEKTLTKQNVEARETILELERQQAEAEAKQMREIESAKAREEAETAKIQQEERLKSERARITTEEELQVAEENKLREVVVAQKNKERTEAVETEKVDRARLLEQTDKDRFVEIAKIEKEKAVEEERKNIQDVIRERVTIEKTVVEEKERMKDIEAFAEADRTKKVAITIAEKDAEESLVKQIKDAEAKKQASEHLAKQQLIDAQAAETAAVHKAAAKKTLAEAQAAEAAAIGMSEAQVMEAKAAASEKEGDAAASIIEAQAFAEAKGIREKGLAQSEADEKLGLVAAKINFEKGQSEAQVTELKADAEEKMGLAEAKVMKEKFTADAEGIKEKAQAMKALDESGRSHEEFKLQLQTDKEVELSKVAIQKEIAMAQASVIAEALKAANIDIVGGETMFFEQIVGSITKGKSVDRMLTNSDVLTQVKDTFFASGNGSNFKERLKDFVDQFGLSAGDLKDLSVSALLLKLSGKASNDSERDMIKQLGSVSDALGISGQKISDLGL
ncbi:MAG: flotillin family protein [Cyclobacteriaceae bacterium]